MSFEASRGCSRASSFLAFPPSSLLSVVTARVQLTPVWRTHIRSKHTFISIIVNI